MELHCVFMKFHIKNIHPFINTVYWFNNDALTNSYMLYYLSNENRLSSDFLSVYHVLLRIFIYIMSLYRIHLLHY